MIYRSADFTRVSPEDQSILAGMGVRNVMDLRTPDELRERPNLLDSHFNQLNLPISTKRMEELWKKTSLGYNQSREERYQYKLNNTTEFIFENIDTVHRIIDLLLDPAMYPVVIHCGQGRDRTGAVIAALLWLLGVDEEEITGDYMMSNDVPNASERVCPEYIRRLYGFLHKSQSLGISETALAHLKRLLVRSTPCS